MYSTLYRKSKSSNQLAMTQPLVTKKCAQVCAVRVGAFPCPEMVLPARVRPRRGSAQGDGHPQTFEGSNRLIFTVGGSS